MKNRKNIHGQGWNYKKRRKFYEKGGEFTKKSRNQAIYEADFKGKWGGCDAKNLFWENLGGKFRPMYLVRSIKTHSFPIFIVFELLTFTTGCNNLSISEVQLRIPESLLGTWFTPKRRFILAMTGGVPLRIVWSNSSNEEHFKEKTQIPTSGNPRVYIPAKFSDLQSVQNSCGSFESNCFCWNVCVPFVSWVLQSSERWGSIKT